MTFQNAMATIENAYSDGDTALILTTQKDTTRWYA